MSAALTQAFSALFVPVPLTLFQVLVILLIVAMLAAVAGMVWGAGVRDHLDEQYMGRDIAGEARAGLIERRLQQRGQCKGHCTAKPAPLRAKPMSPRCSR